MAVRRALRGVLDGLSRLNLTPEESGTVELVLAEALNNVIEHAYGVGRTGWVTLTCRHLPDGLHVVIVDEGRPLPGGALPLPAARATSLPPDDLPEGGFGWFLIRDLARDARYAREGDSNLLSFRIAVGLPARLH